MPKGKSSNARSKPHNNAALELEDAIDDSTLSTKAAPPDEDDEEPAPEVANAVVKMKLATFCTNRRITSRISEYVLDVNRLLGEAYLFANFHVMRVLANPVSVALTVKDDGSVALSLGHSVLPPKLNFRNFYYRCLNAVADNNCHDGTLVDLKDSIAAFDLLRPTGIPKQVVAGQFSEIFASLSIAMATVAKNHLWMNLRRRMMVYTKLRYPSLGKKRYEAIARAVLFEPLKAPYDALRMQPTWSTMSNDQRRKFLSKKSVADLKSIMTGLFPADRLWSRMLKPELVAYLVPCDLTRFFQQMDVDSRDATAYEAVVHLRELVALPQRVSMGKCGHVEVPKLNPAFLLPAYSVMLSTIEASGGATKKQHFSLLPRKSGYTISYIPIPSQFLARILTTSNVDPHARPDKLDLFRSYWEKHFNLNAVETRTSRFANMISTDGVSVSILMDKAASMSAIINDASQADLLQWWESGATAVGVDPGVSVVAMCSSAKLGEGPVKADSRLPCTLAEERTGGYTSGEYYERAKFNLSNRRTDAWNKDTEDIVESIPSGETASLVALSLHAIAYLQHLRELLVHRAARGYRNMRFLRYVHKQRAIEDICNSIAPRGSKTIVGFENWGGVGSTPISRKACGPLKEIKRRLNERNGNDLLLVSVEKRRTSIICNCCHHRTKNMHAHAHRRVQDSETKQFAKTATKVKIHQVLHCQNSMCLQLGAPGRTWNRDVNASLNILLIFLCTVYGLPRPPAF